MPESISSIIYKFSQELKRMLGSKLSKVIVYGSYARGDYRENSDVDVMILVKMSDDEIRQVKNDIYDLTFDIEMSMGIDISPIIKNEEQYEYWVDTLPFYKNVRKEGVVVGERKSNRYMSISNSECNMDVAKVCMERKSYKDTMKDVSQCVDYN